MDNSLHVNFGTPKHGWLPVDLKHQTFHLAFEASDVLNDPIGELYNTLVALQENKSGQVTWWLEPGAYFFRFEQHGMEIRLIISETENLNNDQAARRIIQTISGSSRQIIEPFRKALAQFCSQTFEEDQWPYNLDKRKIEKLFVDK